MSLKWLTLCLLLCSYLICYLTSAEFISADVILSKLNRCEVTQFAVTASSATNQHRLTGTIFHGLDTFTVSQTREEHSASKKLSITVGDFTF